MTDDSNSSVPAHATGPRGGQLPCVALIGEAAAMLRFYSRLPLPSLGAFDDPAHPPPFQRAARMLPVASLLIALAPALTTLALSLTALPHLFTATLGTAVGLIVTGALHEDGLADLADGFGGGGSVARKLEIMKDSRIGSYGGSALILALISRITLIATMMDHSGLIAATSLMAAAILSRSLSLGVFAWLPPARPDGVAAAVGRPDGPAMMLAAGLTLSFIIILSAPWLGADGLGFTLTRLGLGIVAASIAAYGLGRLARSQIGGQTGDVLGAVQVVSEIAFLAGLVAISS